ncbi:hypothetical protein DPMN_003500 [Dreissena polymorpha]|uniref:Uncharacterized protein n=1 Tax=Dreissena polymorpha TaxID=45954 RepID=A0A9D4MP02_DREPO|nr:hypothetical protein DPMN_003500 [Dreissena polymorpha]
MFSEPTVSKQQSHPHSNDNSMNSARIQYLKHNHFPAERPMMEIPKKHQDTKPRLATLPHVHPTQKSDPSVLNHAT